MLKTRIACIVLVAALPGQLVAQSAIEAYPTKPMRLIVPLAPGGSMDITARRIALKLTDNLGQAIVVDNRGGAGGSIGAELAAGAPPDGYTLVMMSATAVIRPLMYQVRYDLFRDFETISQVTTTSLVLMVHPSIPAKSVSQLVTHAKSNPGKLNYASGGAGSLLHLSTELFKASTAIEIVHIPYKGLGAAYSDLVAGHIQVAFGNIVSASPHVRAGRLRALAVSSAQRAKAMPELPTLAEAGVPGFDVTQWNGVLAPARTPRPIVERLNQEIVKVLRQPDLAKGFAADGAEAVGSSPQQFAAHIKAEHDKWAKVINERGIRGE